MANGRKLFVCLSGLSLTCIKRGQGQILSLFFEIIRNNLFSAGEYAIFLIIARHLKLGIDIFSDFFIL